MMRNWLDTSSSDDLTRNMNRVWLPWFYEPIRSVMDSGSCERIFCFVEGPTRGVTLGNTPRLILRNRVFLDGRVLTSQY